MNDLLKLNGFQEISKKNQKSINGGNGNNCTHAISFDGTMCLCLGYVPQGGICVPSNQ